MKRLIYCIVLGENTFKTVPNKGSYLGKGEIMILILCEKPSQARNYASAMGGSVDKKFKWKGQDVIIVNARGHLYQWADVDVIAGPSYSKWSLTSLPWSYKDFKWKRVVADGCRDVINNIKEKAKGCSEIWIATDNDESGEGDLLAAEVLIENKLCRGKVIKRLFHVSESKRDIEAALANPVVIEDLENWPPYQKALFRSKWDYLSMQATRVLTLNSPIKAVLATGRLKGAMVTLVGNQEELVNNHKSVFYFQNRFRDDNGNVYVNEKEPKFDEESKVPNTYKPSAVRCIKSEMKKTAPPKMLDLASLSASLASRGYKPANVLSTYQKMYEASIVTYPRTDDHTITHEQFLELVCLAPHIAKVIGVDVDLLTHTKARSSHVKEEGSHGANRPGEVVPKSLADLETRFGKIGVAIYTMLAKSALSILADDYEYEQQTGEVVDYPLFIAKVNIPKKSGWKAVYGQDLDDEEEITSKGIGKKASPFVYKGEPPKPSKPTMKWLMKQLEKYNVGTGATRTSTLSQITSERANYPLMSNHKGLLSLTQYGSIEHKLLAGTLFGGTKLTEHVMAIMKKIGQGQFEYIDKHLEEMATIIEKEIPVVSKNRESVRVERPITQPKQEGKTSTGEEVKFKDEWNGHKFTPEEIEKLLNGETIDIFDEKFKNKKGNKYGARGSFEWQEYKGHKFYGFKLQEFLNVN